MVRLDRLGIDLATCRTPSRSCSRTCCGAPDGRDVSDDDVDCARRVARTRRGAGVHAGPGADAGLHGRAGRRRPRRHPQRGGAGGRRPRRVDPLVPVDLVIDHSVQVDLFGTEGAYEANIEWEYRRNGERYALLRWAQQAFDGFRVVPPGMGICHQVNLEHLGRVVQVRDGVAMPDTLVGTDSHTTMVNGLSVLGWGVGGIEAEAAMLGQPMFLPQPVVVGVRIDRRAARGDDGHRPGADADADAPRARRRREFVEFFGDGLRRSRGGPRHALQHVPGVRGDRVVLPVRRADAPLPARHRPRRRGRPGRALHEGAGSVPDRRRPRAGVQRDARPRPVLGRAVARRTAAAAGPRAALRRFRARSSTRSASAWRSTRGRPSSAVRGRGRPGAARAVAGRRASRRRRVDPETAPRASATARS